MLERLRRLQDREAIRDLHDHYCLIQDHGRQGHARADVEAFLELCRPDIAWDNSLPSG